MCVPSKTNRHISLYIYIGIEISKKHTYVHVHTYIHTYTHMMCCFSNEMTGIPQAGCPIRPGFIYTLMHLSLSLVHRGRGFASPARTTDRVSSLEELLLRTRAFGPFHCTWKGPSEMGPVESPVVAGRES